MRPCLFDSFADMIGALPAAAVLATLERERVLLENDLAHRRFPSLLEVSSILSFCWFIEALRRGWAIFAAPAPPSHHLALYRTTLQRLIDAGELPARASSCFDQAFYPGRARHHGHLPATAT